MLKSKTIRVFREDFNYAFLSMLICLGGLYAAYREIVIHRGEAQTVIVFLFGCILTISLLATTAYRLVNGYPLKLFSPLHTSIWNLGQNDNFCIGYFENLYSQCLIIDMSCKLKKAPPGTIHSFRVYTPPRNDILLKFRYTVFGVNQRDEIAEKEDSRTPLCEFEEIMDNCQEKVHVKIPIDQNFEKYYVLLTVISNDREHQRPSIKKEDNTDDSLSIQLTMNVASKLDSLFKKNLTSYAEMITLEN